MSRKKPRVYDKEFKLNAINLYLSSGRPYDQISDELGIPVGTLVTWVQTHKKDGIEAFPGKGHLKPSGGKGHLKPSGEEIAQLRKELAIVREERDILKKAVGIFSSQRK